MHKIAKRIRFMPIKQSLLFLSHPIAYLALYLVWIIFFAVLLSFGEFDFGAGSPQKAGPIDALYLSTVTITTLGYGDVTPVGTYSKVVCGLESIVGILTIGFFLNAIAQKINRNNITSENQKFEDIRRQVYYRVHRVSEDIRKLVWSTSGTKMYLSYGSSIGLLLRDCRNERLPTHPENLLSVGLFPPTKSALDAFEAKLEHLARDLGESTYPFIQFLPAEFSEVILKFQTRFQINRENFGTYETIEGSELQRRAFDQVFLARSELIDVQTALFVVATKVKTRDEFLDEMRSMIRVRNLT